MNRSKRKKIMDIARRVRFWAEELYDEDQKDKAYFYEDLGGMCGIVSTKLCYELQRENISAKIGCNNYHAFVLIGKYILDVTATQFDSKFKKVMFFRPKEKEKGIYSFWDIDNISDTPNDFIKFQKDSEWDDTQCAYHFSKKIFD